MYTVRCRPQNFHRLRRAYQASGGACGAPKKGASQWYLITTTADRAEANLGRRKRARPPVGSRHRCGTFNALRDRPTDKLVSWRAAVRLFKRD